MRVFRRLMLSGGIDIDIDALPDTQKLYYKATIKVRPNTGNPLGAPLFANKWDSTTGDGIIACINDITIINNRAFADITYLTSITIPDSVISINDSAFYACYKLKSVTIGKGLTSIGNIAFWGCYSLTNITIPDSVTEIGEAAFSNCTSMQYYDLSTHKLVPILNNNVFYNIPSTCKIIVPDSLYDEWIIAEHWVGYASYIIKKSDWDNLQTA